MAHNPSAIYEDSYSFPSSTEQPPMAKQATAKESKPNDESRLEGAARIAQPAEESTTGTRSSGHDLEHQIAALSQADRDPTLMRIIAANGHGKKGVLWARLDTGSCANFITPALVHTLGMWDQLQNISDMKLDDQHRMRRGPKEYAIVERIHVSGVRKDLPIKKILWLDFWARGDHKKYSDVPFELLPEDPEAGDSFTNRRPDIYLGAPWLTENHVLTLDPECDMEDPGLDEFEPKPDTEDDFAGKSFAPSIYRPTGKPSSLSPYR